MSNRYRVVADRFAGYEAQVKYWWFPFVWWQFGGTNTHCTVEKAKDYITGLRYTKEVLP